jgi:hypothetical protein
LVPVEIETLHNWSFGMTVNGCNVPKAVVEFLFLNGRYLHCHRRSNDWPVSLSLPRRKARRTAALSFS